MLPKLLITGGNGMIGTTLVKRLYKKYSITVIDRESFNLSSYMKDIVFVSCNISDTDEIIPYLNDTFAVIHLAAAVHWTPKNKKDIQEFNDINVSSTERLFIACANNGVERILFFSTSDVYDKSEFMVSEDYPVMPNTIYAKTKYSAELAAQKTSKETGIPICIFRPAVVFGMYDKGSMKSLINICRIGIVPVVEKGKNLKSLLYVEDLAIAVDKYLQSTDSFGGQVFNIASGTYTFNQILDIIMDVFNFNLMKINIPKWIVYNIFVKLPILSKISVSSSTKAIDFKKYYNATGYIPEYTLKNALKRCAHYYYNRAEFEN